MTTIKEMFNLEGHLAVVTGGGQGLGRGMALSLASAGADVAILDLNPETAQSVAGEIEALGRRAMGIQTDVSDYEQVQEAARRVQEAWGPASILVNNAGTSCHDPSAEMALKDWQRVMDVNMTGVFIWCQVFGRSMIAAKRGRIINISSMSGLIVNRDVPQAPYYASKAGVIMLTKALAAEWAPFSINVNAIAPGYMRTPLNEGFLADPQRAAEWTSTTPMGRVGEPEDLAGAVVYLASDASSFVTGHVLVVDGGFTLW